MAPRLPNSGGVPVGLAVNSNGTANHHREPD